MKTQAGSTVQLKNNLKQIALAMHNMHDTYNYFPDDDGLDDDNKGNLSWRVWILPYMEQAALYNQFHLDEPWDSPHNINLLKYMPPVYQSLRREAKQGETYLQLVTGAGTAFPDPAASPRPWFNDCFPRLLIVEAAESVPGTKPDDIGYSPQLSVTALGGDFGVGRFLGAYGDGSVRWHSQLSDEALRAGILGTK